MPRVIQTSEEREAARERKKLKAHERRMSMTPEERKRKKLKAHERRMSMTPEEEERERKRAREYQRAHRQSLKGEGWQKVLGLTVESNPESRLCQRPQRVPGVAPPCELDTPELNNRQTRITLPSLNHPSLVRLLS